MKNKPKPWYRLRNIILVVVLAIIAWPTYIVIWALTVKPNPSVDYALKAQALAIDSQPDGENAWPLLMDAISIVQQIEKSLLEEGESIDYFSELDFDLIYETDADERNASHVWVYSAHPAVTGAFGLALAQNSSYLLAREGRRWRIVRAWPHDAPGG